MSNEITKDELGAMLDVMTRYATNLENIANSFRNTCEELKGINARLNNGLKKDITDQVKENLDLHFKEVGKEHIELLIVNKEIKSISTTIEENIKFTKWFVGISSFVIIVATVVLRGIDNRQFLSESLETKMKTVIQNELKVQMPLLLEREFDNYRNKNMGSRTSVQ